MSNIDKLSKKTLRQKKGQCANREYKNGKQI